MSVYLRSLYLRAISYNGHLCISDHCISEQCSYHGWPFGTDIDRSDQHSQCDGIISLAQSV